MYKFRTNEPLSPHEYKMIIENGVRQSDEHKMIIYPQPQKGTPKPPYAALTNPGIKLRHDNRIAVFIKGLFEIGGEHFGNHRRDGVTPALLLCMGFQVLMQA